MMDRLLVTVIAKHLDGTEEELEMFWPSPRLVRPIYRPPNPDGSRWWTGPGGRRLIPKDRFPGDPCMVPEYDEQVFRLVGVDADGKTMVYEEVGDEEG